MKLLTEATEYGLRAVVWLAQHPERTCKTREIAEGTRSAPGYLVKVLQSLARAGILSGQRGSHGGFRLERDPASLAVLDVINAIDPIERIRSCPLDLEAHGDRLCPLHQQIDNAVAVIERTFADVSIADLVGVPSAPLRSCRELECSCGGAKPGAERGEAR